MILVIDNYDSFTYNLLHYIAEAGAEVVVYRNDAIGVAELMAQRPDGIVISPGPGTPQRPLGPVRMPPPRAVQRAPPAPFPLFRQEPPQI